MPETKSKTSTPKTAAKAAPRRAAKKPTPVTLDRSGDLSQFGCVAQSASAWIASCESAEQVVCLVDEAGHILYANRCVEHWGLIADARQAVGQSVHALLHPGCDLPTCPLAGLDAEVAATLARNRIEVGEIDDPRLDRHFEWMIMPVLVSHDMTVGVARNAAIFQINDVTSQKRTESWLRDSIDELSQELKRRTGALEQAVEQSQRAETALRRSESELKLVSAALMTMQEMERKRIATELHDSIGQSLTALSFGVSTALGAIERGDTRTTRELLDKLGPQVKETIAEVRRIAMDLRPTTLDDLGIIGTLSWFFREFRVIHNDISLQTDVRLQEHEVTPALRTTLFRVVQEAVNNILKHAQAHEISIRLWSSDRAIHLDVSDDGRGFRVAESHAAGLGMGLKSMRDRAEFSGGQFEIDSEPGKGTRISASWPRHVG